MEKLTNVTSAFNACALCPGGWYPDTSCPSQGYSGPYAMPVVSAKWGGTNNNAGTCAPNYPRAAPQHNCAHVSFVELVRGWARCVAHGFKQHHFGGTDC
jgi:hypothetical protein